MTQSPTKNHQFNEVGDNSDVLEIDADLFGSELDQGVVSLDHGADSFDPYTADIEEIWRERVDRNPDVPPKGVTREQRAKQIAIQFFERWGWDYPSFEFVN